MKTIKPYKIGLGPEPEPDDFNLKKNTQPNMGLGVCMGRVKGIFDPTHYGELKKIQPNPTHHISPTQLTWVGLDWVKPMG